MQALVGRPFHAAFGFGKNIDGGEDALGGVIAGIFQ